MPAMDAFRERWAEVELDIVSVSGLHASLSSASYLTDFLSLLREKCFLSLPGITLLKPVCRARGAVRGGRSCAAR